MNKKEMGTLHGTQGADNTSNSKYACILYKTFHLNAEKAKLRMMSGIKIDPTENSPEGETRQEHDGVI